MESKKNEKAETKQKVKKIKNNTKSVKPKVDEKVLAEKNKLEEKVLRLMAEMQNIKRHSDEEIARLCKYDGEELIKKILPIVDNFERAIMLDDRDLTDELSKFLSGFKMIYTNLLSILNSMEVKEIECKGLEFNPTNMEAVLTESDKNLPSGVVLEVLQKGYTYKDKIIRVAMVKVNE